MEINVEQRKSLPAMLRPFAAIRRAAFRASIALQARWDIKSGNTVKVWQKIKEGDKFRLQAFEGLIIAHKHGYE